MTNSDLLVNYHDAVVYESDLRLLECPTAWLNDACINFFFTYLQNHGNSHDRFMDPSVVSFFMHQCTDEEDIEDFARNIQFPKKGRIFIPVNDAMNKASSAWRQPLGGQHWSLLLLLRTNEPHKIKFWHFDSVQNSGNGKAARDIANKLQNYVLEEGDAPLSVVEGRTPAQVNGHDCGVHLLFTAELFASINFTEDHAPLNTYEEALHNLVKETPTLPLECRAKIAETILRLQSAGHP